MTPPSVSIVVSTLDRAVWLRRLLASLVHLDYPTFEVVVVAGPSTDDTPAVLAEFDGRIVVRSSPTANLSRSRNVGVAAAAGDVLAFIDDDALPDDVAWLRHLVAPLAADPRVACTGGLVLKGDSSEAEFRGGVITAHALRIDAGGAVPDPAFTWYPRVQGTNFAIRREVLTRLGGFDEWLRYGHDETDLCLRLWHAGHRVEYVAAAVVRHYAAAGRHRRSWHDVDWHTIARSDTYCALKNTADGGVRRIATVLRLAPRKSFLQDIRLARDLRVVGRARYGRYLARWTTGMAAGLWLGLVHARRTPLVPGAAPGALRTFRTGDPPRRLRVGLLSREYLPGTVAGGVATYTRELAHGLHALGHEVHVFTRAATALRREGIRLFVHGVPAEPVPVSWSLPAADRLLRWSLAVAGRVRALAARGTPLDVIESPNWEAPGVALARLAIAPLVVRLVSPLTTLQSAGGWRGTTDLAAAIALERWMIAHADGVIGSTAAVLDSVRETMGVDPARDGRYARIPFGVRPVPARPEPGPGERILFVGRLERRKGIHTLLAIVPALLAAHPTLTVDVVGPDLERPSPQDEFSRRHAGAPWRSRCRFHGQVDDARLDRLYRESSCLVAPSLYESFGLIYLEAMRFGVPVIGCRAGGIPEVVRDGETGLLVSPEDPEALRAAIEHLLADPALRARLGAAGRRAVETEFSAQRMVERTAAFYTEVIDALAGNVRAAARPHG